MKKKYTINYPNTSIYKELEKNAIKNYNFIAYNYFGNKTTYQKFLKQIDDCAKALQSIGVKEKDVISIILPNIPEGVISFYAINKIGAIASMIHPLSSKEEIEYYIKESKTKYIISLDTAVNRINNMNKVKQIISVSPSNSLKGILKTMYNIKNKVALKNSIPIIKWERFIKKGVNCNKPIKHKHQKEDTAVILYSGGTTDVSKGIELTNFSFNAVALQSIKASKVLKKGYKSLTIMPIFHGFGLAIGIHCLLLEGIECILIPKPNLNKIAKQIIKYKPNIIIGVPAIFSKIVIDSNVFKDLSFIKSAISGGDTLPVQLKKSFDQLLKDKGATTNLREGYGLTETVTGCALMPLGKYKEKSIGIPYPDMHFKVVKPGTDKELKTGEIGELVINGPTMMKGYLNDPKSTEKAIKRHNDNKIWISSGDAGYIDEDGFIFVVNRIKRIIISSGYNIYPKNIENIVNENPNVIESCVIGVDDKTKGQSVEVIVTLKNSNKNETLIEIKKLCESKLPKYSWPKHYNVIDEFPKTKVGKINFNNLKH